MKETDVVFTAAGKSDEVARLAWGSPSTPYGIILGHGASGSLDSGHLPEIAQAFADAGIWCLRFETKPDFTSQALLRRALELQSEGTIPVLKWVQAGHSMGGRVASAVAHVQPASTLGCVFFSYPLHPPRKQDELRDDPLTSLQAPVLFVRGTRDAFCEGEQFEAVLKRMTSHKVEVHEVSGGDHSLKVKGGKKAVEEALAAALSAAVAFVQQLGQADNAGPKPDEGAGADAEPAAEEEAARDTDAEGAGADAEAAMEKEAAQGAEADAPPKQNKRKKAAKGDPAPGASTKKRTRSSAK